MADIESPGALHSRLSKITVLALLCLAVVFSFREIAVSDLGFHLRAGEWMLEHLRFPGKDPFTYTADMNDYVDMDWLYQVQAGVTKKLSGEFGLVLVNALLVAGCFAIALVRCHRQRPIRETSYWHVTTFLAILATAALFETSPRAFSCLFLGLTILILEEASERGTRSLVFLPIVLLLWTNTHTAFILGWIVIAGYIIGVAWRDKKIWTPLTAYGLLSILISFASPYGFKGVALPFQQLQFLQAHRAFAGALAENRSPLELEGYLVNGRFLLLQPLLGFHLFALVSGAAFISSLKKIQLHQFIVFLLLGYVALLGAKNIGYFVFAVFPWTIGSLQRRGAARAGWARFIPGFSPARFQTVLAVVTIVASLSLIQAIVTNAYYLDNRSNDRFGFRYNEHSLPTQAAEFLRRNELEGRILNQFNLGGFLIGAIPQRVFIDGRNEVMGDRLFAEYSILWNGISKKPLLEKYNPDIVILPHQSEFLWVHYMRKDTLWRLVHFDELAAIYLKRGYADSIPSITAGDRLGGYQRVPQSGIDSVLRRSDASAISLFSFRERYFPQKEVGLSTFCYYDDAFDAGIQYGLNALLLSTVPCPEVYYNLGHNFFENKDFNRAAYCYERFLRTNDNELARERLLRIRSPQPASVK
ncbi:MAG: hypothetical protein E6K56_00665 [Ignavibacteria bacterium]|nr:MAG: hypothetical protein E6K56_00665 [Ignavibacteria bacterium]